MGSFGTTDKRPGKGDQGKRVWVWPLPGTLPSQVRTGMLAGWDDEDMKLDNGHAYPWVTIKGWGFGDPPGQLPT